MLNRRWLLFNIFLLAVLVTASGCNLFRSEESKQKNPRTGGGKVASTLRLHYVINPDGTDRCLQVPIGRTPPMVVTVDRTPFLHEGYVAKAELLNTMGTYEIKVQFDHFGGLTLENVSVSQKGHNIAIYSDFGDSRWIAAPLLSHRISDGALIFTPDASRQEAERIVKGLNNVAGITMKKKLEDGTEEAPKKK
ncbi:MAG: hypothetical protein WCO56_21490 [Verrucomicrobiota bacterium]